MVISRLPITYQTLDGAFVQLQKKQTEGAWAVARGHGADSGILTGLSLGSLCSLPWPRCPHTPGSSSGVPFSPPQLGRRHLGNKWASKGDGAEREGEKGGFAKKALRVVGW